MTITPEEVKVISVPSLLELQLASSVTPPFSFLTKDQDKIDARDLIFALNLTDAFVIELSPFIRANYLELVDEVRLVSSQTNSALTTPTFCV